MRISLKKKRLKEAVNDWHSSLDYRKYTYKTQHVNPFLIRFFIIYLEKNRKSLLRGFEISFPELTY